MSMTHRERMIAAISGDMPDRIPYAPRIDTWYASRKATKTLPEPYANYEMDDICRAEGWGLYKVTADYLYIKDSVEDIALTSLGLYAPPHAAFKFKFQNQIGVETEQNGDTVLVTYHTPIGSVSACMEYNEQMQKDGVTYPWVRERLIKNYEDWKIVASVFDHLEVVPNYDQYLNIKNKIGDAGVQACQSSDASSPMHHIQKTFFNPTDFYIYYRERSLDMETFAESIANYYHQVLDILVKSPAEIVEWGGNFDATITFPPYFEKEILPWLKKASEALRPAGKYLLAHCDGENQGLMALIKNSGIDAAESVCPYPMTRLHLHEYYEQWSDKITIVGGIPAEFLVKELTSEDEFKDYINYLFKAVAPGRRFFAGITDATPASADFDRLRMLNDMFESAPGLPLKSGKFHGMPERQSHEKDSVIKKQTVADQFLSVQKTIMAGDANALKLAIKDLRNQNIEAAAILQKGMIAAMNIVGDLFAAGQLFIPEMLLAAKAMETGVDSIKDDLMASGSEHLMHGTILLGTVYGDLHDIGKNLVAIMLRGVGFKVVDLGTNVSTAQFIEKVTLHKPAIIALSALLTTTLPEMVKLIETLVEIGLRDTVKVMIGGAPVSQKFSDQIGADGYAENAGEAVTLAKRLLAGN